MSEEKSAESAVKKSTETIIEKSAPLTKAEKKLEYNNRVIRTAIASFMGILMGILSFMLIGDPTSTAGEPKAILGWLFLLAGIVFQKHIFMIFKIDYTKLGGKDWFYQGFMTFAFWFISWTILLTMLNYPLIP